jgi:hypothetical protein
MAVRLDDPVGAKLSYLLENRISFYVLPNSFAAAPGGFDDALAERLGLAATSMLRPTNFEPQYKIAVFTPAPPRSSASATQRQRQEQAISATTATAPLRLRDAEPFCRALEPSRPSARWDAWSRSRRYGSRWWFPSASFRA